MKTGIVSIYDNSNIGNRLQNYALQKVLMDYSGDVVTIKNIPQCSGLRRIKNTSFVAETPFLFALRGQNRPARMLRFTHKYINKGRTFYFYNLPNVALKKRDICDYYCAGSDQIWNPNFGRSEMFNYLGFADREQTFSYAASFGVDEIPERHKEAVRKGLQHIKHISVREEAGKRIVEELTGRTDVAVLVDPTMLLTTREWDEILRRPKATLPEKYVLTYFLGPVSSQRRKIIQEKATQMGCALIEVMDKNSPFYAIGPDQFVYLVKNAELVCTDSFHGSVFSFLYQRKLAIFDREGKEDNMSSRIDTFTTKFDLKNCRVSGNTLSENIPSPDYSRGYQTLEEERAKSKTFLDMVFGK